MTELVVGIQKQILSIQRYNGRQFCFCNVSMTYIYITLKDIIEMITIVGTYHAYCIT